MAGDWIKMRVNLDSDPAVFQIAAQLGLDELSVVGRLWKVWAWADQHVGGECHATGVTDVTLDRISTTPGFAAAMRRVGWITGETDSPALPRFDRHNGQSAKTRALATERQAKKRHADVTLESRPMREQRREEKSNTPIVPKGDDSAGVSVEMVQPDPPELLRARAIFRMRPGTPLDRSLGRAWKTARAAVADTTDDEWRQLESYYCDVIASRDDYRRKDLATLLNNWSTELTRAAAHCQRHGLASGNSQKKEMGGPSAEIWHAALAGLYPEMDPCAMPYAHWSEIPPSLQQEILVVIAAETKKEAA